MDLIAKFGERLKDLIFEHKLTAELLGKILNHNVHDIYHWKSGKGKYMPSVENLLKLADYFCCSVEFLLGLEEENRLPNPKLRPPFSDRFRRVAELKGFTLYKLGKATKMGTAQYYAWINKASEPSLDSLMRIAAVLDCSVDYLLGRE